MYVTVPHQRKPRFGCDCIMGTWDCDADCPGCRDRRDCNRTVGEPNTAPEELRKELAAYIGHQQYTVRALAKEIL